eukprot:6214768-Pleurochrysis_carterae.AAC.5
MTTTSQPRSSHHSASRSIVSSAFHRGPDLVTAQHTPLSASSSDVEPLEVGPPSWARTSMKGRPAASRRPAAHAHAARRK